MAADPTSLPELLSPIDRLIASVQAMPWAVHVLAGVACGAGIILWLAGRKVLRPAAVTVGASLGSILGFLLLPTIAPDSGVSPYVGLLGGLLAGFVVMLVLYKPLTAVMFGGVSGLAAALATATILSLASGGAPAAAMLDNPPPAPLQPPSSLGGEEQGIRPSTDDPGSDDPSADPEAGPKPRLGGNEPSPVPSAHPPAKKKTVRQAMPADKNEPAVPKAPATVAGNPQKSTNGAESDHSITLAAAHAAENFWMATRQTAAENWQATPAAHRTWVIIAGIAGTLVGLAMGILLPAWAAGAVTSLFGSAVFLLGGAWLAHATGAPGHEHLSLPVSGWLIVWVVAGLLGMAIQWYGLVGVSETSPAGSKRKRSGRSKNAEKD